MSVLAPRGGRARGAAHRLDRPERAVVDIGSNTVRLVVYGGPRRAPVIWLNEKVSARLGRDLATTGLIPDKAAELALRGLARFAAIIADLGVPEVHTVATAAVREAANGAALVEQVRALGLPVRVLSGEEEAVSAAYGVIGAFPGAQGVVADLGGGSLELVSVAGGASAHGVSLPLGTLRLPALRADGAEAFQRAVTGEMRRAGWAADQSGPLYLVGGTFRAMASFAMHEDGHPLTDPHALHLAVADADRIARKLARMAPATLASMAGITASRAAGLPDAAALLRPVLEELRPDGLVFSSWGLREGILFQGLDPAAREQDPLLASIAYFAEPRGCSLTQAAKIAAWTTSAANGGAPGNERLRLAAAMLAMVAARVEPNLRVAHALDWALHKRWLGLDHRGRAMLAAALRGASGRPEVTAELARLASEADLREAAGWGLAVRLCRRFGAGTRVSLLSSRLLRDGDALVLWVEPGRAQLVSDSVEGDLRALAQWLGLGWRIDIGQP